MLKESLNALVRGESLTPAQARGCMVELASGDFSPAQAAAFLTALQMKGATEGELCSMAQVMREKSTRISAPGNALDVCGTGGDSSNSFNISTASGFVVAACGVPVVKHGNRGVSSRCGSADVIGQLGGNTDLSPAQAETALLNCGFTFLSAPHFHPSFAAVGQVRREIAIRTVFNLLGPLCNPAGVKFQMMGVYDAGLTGKMASVLGMLGSTRALVVHGGGMDELCLHAPCNVSELSHGTVESYSLPASDFGFAPAPIEALCGGDALANSMIIKSVLSGEEGPRRDVVLLNSSAALYAAGKAPTIASGIPLCESVIDSGKALEVLEKFVAFTSGKETAVEAETS